jgi:hypothetical protein
MATIRVEPARIILNELTNKQSTGIIEVINNSEEEVELTAILNDWSLDENNELIVYDPGVTEYTLDRLIKFNPKIFTLSPGGKQIVRFTIAKPENNIDLERRGVIFFERDTGMIDEATGSIVKSQIGSVIYFIPQNTTYEFQFLGLRLYNTENNIPQGIVVDIKNIGNAHLRYYPSYKIINNKNELVMENKFEELIILPGYERQFSFYLKDRLESGKYNFILEFEFFNVKEKAEYQIPITIE